MRPGQGGVGVCGPPLGGQLCAPTHRGDPAYLKAHSSAKPHTLGLETAGVHSPGVGGQKSCIKMQAGPSELLGRSAPDFRSAPGGPGSPGLHSIRASLCPHLPVLAPSPSLPVPHRTPSLQPQPRSPLTPAPEGAETGQSEPCPACSLKGRGRGGAGQPLAVPGPSEAQSAPTHPVTAPVTSLQMLLQPREP